MPRSKIGGDELNEYVRRRPVTCDRAQRDSGRLPAVTQARRTLQASRLSTRCLRTSFADGLSVFVDRAAGWRDGQISIVGSKRGAQRASGIGRRLEKFELRQRERRPVHGCRMQCEEGIDVEIATALVESGHRKCPSEQRFSACVGGVHGHVECGRVGRAVKTDLSPWHCHRVGMSEDAQAAQRFMTAANDRRASSLANAVIIPHRSKSPPPSEMALLRALIDCRSAPGPVQRNLDSEESSAGAS